ncbi:MAG TPA: response regulator transcription factor [Dehalococcoidia bacterium]|nr:response regulator transcription factor [Dehalococcoidia bacterium]
MKFLVIEDNQQVVRDLSLCLYVRYPQSTIISTGDVEKGMGMLEIETPDLVMVDSSLPNIEILDLITRIREFSDVPLIVLSEGETDMDRARGLETGADEYVTKPFNPLELLAKIKALFRRTLGTGFALERDVYSAGRITVNLTTHEVMLSDKQIRLTPTEFRLLSELVINEGRVLTHRRLLEKVWGPEYVGDLNFTKKYIYRLRQKLGDDPDNPLIIRTERGVGYKLVRTP